MSRFKVNITQYRISPNFRLKEKEDEHSSLSSDTDTTVDNSVDSDNIVSKMIPTIKVDEASDREIDK